MIKQWREIGGSNWNYCETEAWFKYCNASPEHETKLAPKGSEAYSGQFETKGK